VRGHLQVDHVNFGYGDGPAMLHDLSMEARPGRAPRDRRHEWRGKSTLMQLLRSVLRAHSGTSASTAMTGGWPNPRSAPSTAGDAEAQLFDGTVAENIRSGA